LRCPVIPSPSPPSAEVEEARAVVFFHDADTIVKVKPLRGGFANLDNGVLIAS
jgi:hypothetical protein